MQLAKVLQFDSVSSRLADAVDSHQTTAELTRLYHELNRLKDFATAFPPVESLKHKNEDALILPNARLAHCFSFIYALR